MPKWKVCAERSIERRGGVPGLRVKGAELVD